MLCADAGAAPDKTTAPHLLPRVVARLAPGAQRIPWSVLCHALPYSLEFLLHVPMEASRCLPFELWPALRRVWCGTCVRVRVCVCVCARVRAYACVPACRCVCRRVRMYACAHVRVRAQRKTRTADGSSRYPNVRDTLNGLAQRTHRKNDGSGRTRGRPGRGRAG